MQQVMFGGEVTNLSSSATQYSLPGYPYFNTEVIGLIAPMAGTIKSFRLDLLTAPGSGKSRIFTIHKNGSPTDLSITISDLADSGSDLVHEVSFIAGDLISLVSTVSGTPAQSYCRHSFILENPTNNQSIIHGVGVAQSTYSAVTTFNASLIAGSVNTAAGDFWGHVPVPFDSTFKNLSISLAEAPGAGKSLTFTLQKNGIDTTHEVIISNTDTYGVCTTDPIDLAPGDFIRLKVVKSETDVNWGGRLRIAGVLESDADNLYMMAATGGSAMQNSGINYTQVSGLYSTGIAIGAREQMGQTPVTIKTLYAHIGQLSGNPQASGKGYTFTLRKNGVDTALTVNVEDGAKFNSASVDVIVADGDYFETKIIPINSPGADGTHIPVITYVLESPSIPGDEYSYEDVASLPSNDDSMSNLFVSGDYDDVAAQDDTTFDLLYSDKGVILLKKLVLTGENIQAKVRFKSTLAPSTANLVLQVYNQNTPAWETVDIDNVTVADTYAFLEANIITNVANYLDENNIATFRVYQEVPE